MRLLSLVLIFSGIGLAFSPLYPEFVQTAIVAADQSSDASKTATDFDLKAGGSNVIPQTDLVEGEIFGVLYAPRLGADYRRPIGQGTSVEQVLNRVGVGHYRHSALPYQDGNFALAAHRTTYGGSFNNIDRFVPGDKIYIETNWGWFEYEVIESRVVEPSALWAVSADPLKLGPARYLTLTTCTPRYTAEKRLAVWAKQVKQYSRAMGAPDALQKLLASDG